MPTAIEWIATPDIAPDYGGPTDRPFTPFRDIRAAPPILEMLYEIALGPPLDAIVEEDGRALTMANLLGAAAQLGRRIEQTGAGPVGLLLPSTTDYVVAVLAALYAQRPCLLLDANYPDGRNDTLAATAGADVVLHPSTTAPPRWPGVTAVAVAPASCELAVVPRSGKSLDMDVPAFILPTSGSEGNPRLIAHSQRSILHWARTVHDGLHVDPTDRSLSLSSFCTLGGFVALLTFPSAGASLQMFDIKRGGFAGLLALLAEKPVTILRGTPSLLRSLTKIPGIQAALKGLRAVQLYGEPLMRSDLDDLIAVLPDSCSIRTTYGSTEASGMTWFARAGDSYDSHRVATGFLMPDTTAAIVDDEGASVAPGEAGELLIKSRYNALGEWTGARLATGGFEVDRGDPAVRIFRSGDIAKCHADGVFVVLGRKDRMVKVNGQRIEPAEIEAALRRSAMVERAEVLASGRNGTTRLTAFVVASAEAPPDLATQLKDRLRASLPSFMVPGRVIVVPAIPMLPGGKVDAAALHQCAELPGGRA